MSTLPNKVAVNVLCLPERNWQKNSWAESSSVVFRKCVPAPSRLEIGQARARAYQEAIEDGFEYVGWVDDDDWCDHFYFTCLAEELDKRPDLAGICAPQVVSDKLGNTNKREIASVKSFTTVKLAFFHGPCLWRASAIKNELKYLHDFYGLDENRYFARHLQDKEYKLGSVFFLLSYLVR